MRRRSTMLLESCTPRRWGSGPCPPLRGDYQLSETHVGSSRLYAAGARLHYTGPTSTPVLQLIGHLNIVSGMTLDGATDDRVSLVEVIPSALIQLTHTRITQRVSLMVRQRAATQR